MAHMAQDGKKFTNRPPMMAHNRSIERQPTDQPGMDEGEPEMGDKPMNTEHHEDGTHTTHHMSGAVKHHATAEELVDHLKKHMPEEEHEIETEGEPEYE